MSFIIVTIIIIIIIIIVTIIFALQLSSSSAFRLPRGPRHSRVSLRFKLTLSGCCSMGVVAVALRRHPTGVAAEVPAAVDSQTNHGVTRAGLNTIGGSNSGFTSTTYTAPRGAALPLEGGGARTDPRCHRHRGGLHARTSRDNGTVGGFWGVGRRHCWAEPRTDSERSHGQGCDLELVTTE